MNGEAAAPASAEAAAAWPEKGGRLGNGVPVAGARREDGREGEKATGNPFEASPAAEVDGEGLATAGWLGGASASARGVRGAREREREGGGGAV